MFHSYEYIFIKSVLSSLVKGRELLIHKKLTPFYLGMLCAMFARNYLCGSGEEFFLHAAKDLFSLCHYIV